MISTDREFSDIQNFYDRGIKNPERLYRLNKHQKHSLKKYKNKSVDLKEKSFLAENNMDVIKSIVKNKGAKNIKMKDGKFKDGYVHCICDYECV